ncbi:phenylalanine--tRNA ligase subunit alpha ASCRUDRAFT_75033 [Ascoidea rubescens DSM 1968]|uniref:phenylalanine--tRNA ligase n=1 Tax=Ascoidea rubescens DSM 1968 TaxID=1344418 RepID=A0A1D2VJE8_9ASCO|nr:hypothetical protein ASCRUDRAFT_75033 [Ascoidea rubescens DSM 1968]ODV61742.1 hypothetical protein ASCRUDRAFT_75033 [Ascoidea rubescens DSM 1968]
MSLESRILQTLNDSDEIVGSKGFENESFDSMKAVLSSLFSSEMIDYRTNTIEKWVLTDEGSDIASNGSYEYNLLKTVIKLNGLSLAEVSKIKNGKIGQAKAFRNKWISKNGNTLIASDLYNLDNLPIDETAELLLEIQKNGTLDNKKVLADLKKRKLISLTKVFTFDIKKSSNFALQKTKFEADITMDLIQNDSYKSASFKPYNFKTKGVPVNSGALHPLNKIKTEFKEIFISMGFKEMPTSQYVESGFWNFDTLYVPQMHPARDLQDTFYLSDPSYANPPEDKTYWENTKNAHEGGYYGSIGYRYPWKGDESLKTVLRTHTTAISSQMLYHLAKDPKPIRLFSIDKVFRNEAVDATHLAEFHQVEGVLADYNISLTDLISFMEDFFSKMGVYNLKFKPAYNPYTEPSLEIFSYHKGLDKWVEIGNSGMFRPEMLQPMGLPKNLNVLGWGLSLERPTMIKYGVSNIRELLGHKVSLDFIEHNPAARLDEDLY